jgi:hypothetical protein
MYAASGILQRRRIPEAAYMYSYIDLLKMSG